MRSKRLYQKINLKTFVNHCAVNLGKREPYALTTNRKLGITWIAIYMFARWCQEFFFKCLRQEYDIDRMMYYPVRQINEGVIVVNPIHSKLTQSIKMIREKISRRQAKLFLLNEKNVNSALETSPHYLKKQITQINQINQLKDEEQKLVEARNKQPYKIEVKNMPENKRYTKLDMESKLFQNIIKMICYLAETTISLLVTDDIWPFKEGNVYQISSKTKETERRSKGEESDSSMRKSICNDLLTSQVYLDRQL